MTMKKINAFEQGEAILKTLSKGAFLTTAAGGKQNTMTIGWGSLGFKWGAPTFTVMVRQSRYTKELIDANPEFTVSFPVNEGFAKAVALCGTKSGRDMDKFAEAGLEAIPGETVSVPVIKGCSLHLECKIVEHYTMEADKFDKELGAKWYGAGDWHTCYTGVITAAYIEE
ncbi:flavin reductase family protein [uncultured Phascolarctobacterium sp.]|uniref:flavin reductase family protein n=1 Tax=uncultured Phascolarctobacterium sp. TaxID=512296 RepID=UPI0025D32346|nr:flavin reductase family protein [uncultured Phascolarctobacterium sp.]